MQKYNPDYHCDCGCNQQHNVTVHDEGAWSLHPELSCMKIHVTMFGQGDTWAGVVSMCFLFSSLCLVSLKWDDELHELCFTNVNSVVTGCRKVCDHDSVRVIRSILMGCFVLKPHWSSSTSRSLLLNNAYNAIRFRLRKTWISAFSGRRREKKAWVSSRLSTLAVAVFIDGIVEIPKKKKNWCLHRLTHTVCYQKYTESVSEFPQEHFIPRLKTRLSCLWTETSSRTDILYLNFLFLCKRRLKGSWKKCLVITVVQQWESKTNLSSLST